MDVRKKILWGSILGVVALGLVLAICFVIDTALMLDVSKLTTLKQSTVLLDRDGQQAALVSGSENRTVVGLKDIPEYTQKAFIAAEDARFYQHHGIDVYRIGGALLSNIKSGDYGQGASTITQQLIKLTHLTQVKSLKRKAQEAILALRLEMVMGKDEILEAYLNTVYFGAGAYGIEAASRTYFGVPASQLTLSQSALLAGVIKSPSGYAPHLQPDKAITRRNLVLEKMRELGFITQEALNEARSESISILGSTERAVDYAWYVDEATREAVRLLKIDREELLSGGYRLYTALDQAMQKSAERIFLDASAFPADAPDGTRPQAAMVCASAQDGAVHALIGGRDYEVERGLNRAIDITRQPGSAFKPVSVYAAAVDRFGYLPSSFAQDVQRDFGKGYRPGNSGGKYNGEVTLREALSRSLNVATVDLLSKTSINAARQYAQNAGIALDAADVNLSLALGSLTRGVSPMALGAAYAPLANGGNAVTPHLIRMIEDADGQMLYQYHAGERHIMSGISARLVTDMLVTAAQSGTAKALGALDFPVAGKTGTVGEMDGGNRDVWTVAYTPKCTLSVWMGFDRPDAAHKLNNSVTGSSHPAKLATEFLRENAEKVDGGAFELPDGLLRVPIDKRALTQKHQAMLLSELTPKAYAQIELFPASRTPTKVSDVWQAPSQIFDLKATGGEDGVTLSFTCVDDYALYRVFRVSEQGAEVIGELSGTRGEVLSLHDGAGGRESAYQVQPVEAALAKEGIELAGPMSGAVSLSAQSRARGEARAPIKIAKETPLFGVPEVTYEVEQPDALLQEDAPDEPQIFE
ncbi:MAG: PBP1A family penicillin-binding protein [Clostridia bacterium]